jgi:hypothetical protein
MGEAERLARSASAKVPAEASPHQAKTTAMFSPIKKSTKLAR